MKTKKENTLSKESVSKNITKSKQKVSRPKAGVSLIKAVKNVQQILKEKKTEATAAKERRVCLTKSKPKVNRFKIRKSPRDKGIVYVGHIPHGFYEEQMEEYFKQFGRITRVRVARSKRTGKSRGYGYVEFFHPEIGQIAAESMNNYLMCGRLLKATFIPPEKQHPRFFSGADWSENNYPKLKNRTKETLFKNRVQSTEDHEKYVKKSLYRLSALESKLQDKGISIKFQPVDVET